MRKLLVVALLVLACNGEDNAVDNNATAPPSPAPELATTAVPVQMVFEGLIAFEQVDKNAPEKGMYALMVDATGANPGADRPPCARQASHYPDHATAIYVEGAELSLTVGGVTTNPGKLVLIEDEDITFEVDPPTPYVATAMSLAKLVDEVELGLASDNKDNGKIVIDRSVYLDLTVTPKALANLAARIFINSGVAVARANSCARVPEEKTFFGFKEIGQADAKYCTSPPVPTPVELGEDVLVTFSPANRVTLTMVTDPGRRERKLVIEPDDTSPEIRISFRNVMASFKDKPEDALCLAPRHLATYQWFYGLTEDPNSGSGCTWIPCVHPGTAGGGKCPNPGPGG